MTKKSDLFPGAVFILVGDHYYTSTYGSFIITKIEDNRLWYVAQKFVHENCGPWCQTIESILVNKFVKFL